MPGHIGKLSFDDRSVNLQDGVEKSLKYFSHHKIHPRTSRPHWVQGFVEDSKNNGSKRRDLGDQILWLDGELYDHEEVLLDPSPEILKLADGYFSMVHFNQKSNTIQLITDRHGIKPLYLFSSEKEFIWATEVKSILLERKGELTLNKEAINAFIELGFFPNNTTYYNEISLLPSASITTFDLNQKTCTSKKYWHPEQWDDKLKIDFNTASQKASALLKEAVDKRIFKNEKTTVALSGGMDSRCLAHLTTDPERTAFTFGLEQSDDMRLATSVAKDLNIKHHPYYSNSESWMDGKLESIWRTEGMFSYFELHSSPFIDQFSSLGDSVFNGFGGATLLGGIFLGKERKVITKWEKFIPGLRDDLTMSIETTILQQHMRRGVNQGSIDVGKSLAQRKPYMDNNLLDFVMRLPASFRSNYKFFSKVLSRTLPPSLLKIPWENTMVSLDQYYLTQLLLWMRWPSIRRRMHWMNPAFDYTQWAKEPSFTSLKQQVNTSDAKWVNIVPKQKHQEYLNSHVHLGRILSVALWLDISEKKQREGLTSI